MTVQHEELTRAVVRVERLMILLFQMFGRDFFAMIPSSIARI